MAVRERLLELPCELTSLFDVARERLPRSVWFDGRGGFGRGWSCGTMFSVDTRQWHCTGEPGRWLDRIDRTVEQRRREGGTGRTGLVVLLGYDALDDPASLARIDSDTGYPATFVVMEVDASVASLDDGGFLLSERQVASSSSEDRADTIRRWGDGPRPQRAAAATARGPARTSLPRDDYLVAVERLKRHITLGDIYQANLTQRIEVPVEGEFWQAYRGLVGRTPAPRSAFIETPEFAMASASPETFVRVTPPDLVETSPIKGTRARSDDPERDRAAARSLLDSEKDRAELLMIVDLERNDLGRICRTGTIEVADPHELLTLPAVHHLVATVKGRLREGIRPGEILRASFPGGSISGAPKIRARQLIGEVEPVRRGFFTGSLLWFGDDGTLDSSILIRTVVFAAGRAWVGAGGGIVADSDPEEEWQESNLKARAATQGLGFDPTEAR